MFMPWLPYMYKGKSNTSLLSSVYEMKLFQDEQLAIFSLI